VNEGIDRGGSILTSSATDGQVRSDFLRYNRVKAAIVEYVQVAQLAYTSSKAAVEVLVLPTSRDLARCGTLEVPHLRAVDVYRLVGGSYGIQGSE